MELLWYDIRTLDTDTMAHTVGMMDEERRRRVNDIAGEDDRRRTVAGEGEVPLRWDEMGKPTVDAVGVYVSVSHSGPYAVCAIADVPIGVDVEVVRSADEKFMRRVCSEAEMAYIRVGDDGDCARFWEIWTAKEALFKLTGKGPLLALSRLALPRGVVLDHVMQKGCALTTALRLG